MSDKIIITTELSNLRFLLIATIFIFLVKHSFAAVGVRQQHRGVKCTGKCKCKLTLFKNQETKKLNLIKLCRGMQFRYGIPSASKVYVSKAMLRTKAKT